MKYALVIFDLDGTLLNTLEDLTAAANHTLEQGGYPIRTREEIRRFIGNGVVHMLRRALPADATEAELQRAVADFRDYYARNVDVHTRPYPGIPELLTALRRAGGATACNSNKPDAAVQALCRRHFDGLLDLAVGEREEVPKKPAPDGARHIMKVLGVPGERTLYVGDGEADLLTARNAGIDCAWVSWGYRKAEELSDLGLFHRFDTAEALSRFIL